MLSFETQKQPQGIDYFGRGHWLSELQAKVSFGARHRMFLRWKAYAKPTPGQSILDVGSTPDRERMDSNCMLPWFEQAGLKVSLYSPEDISNLKDLFPSAIILPAKGMQAPIPADNRSYQWVVSSAVLEHVGNFDRQVDFIKECARVGSGLFLTTPNRMHWLEFHTKLPLIHWLPRPIHRVLLKLLGKTLWARESHLRLVSRSELEAIAAKALGNEFEFNIETIWTLGMPSNLILLANRKQKTENKS